MVKFRAFLLAFGRALLVLGKRLATVDWPKASGEATLIIALVIKIIADARSKNLIQFLTDLESLPGDLAMLGLILRLTTSGNAEAIANPSIPVSDPKIPTDRPTNDHV